jgi:hypothetical protein
MTTTVRFLGGVLLVLGMAALARGDEPPPWQRELKGDAAKKAAALEQRIEELEVAGNFAEAVPPAEAVLALRQRGQGDAHWQTADAARKLGELNLAASLPEAQQQRLGEAVRGNNQAVNLHACGKYADAEPLFRTVRAFREEVLGPKHLATAASCNNLAVNLEAQGKARDAEPLLLRALAIKEEVRGPNSGGERCRHLSTARMRS